MDRVVAFVSGYYSKPDVIRSTIMLPSPPNEVAVVGPPETFELVARALGRDRPYTTWDDDPFDVPHLVGDRLVVFINPGAPDGLQWWHAAAEWCREKATAHLESTTW